MATTSFQPTSLFSKPSLSSFSKPKTTIFSLKSPLPKLSIITCSSSSTPRCKPKLIRCPSLDRRASEHHRLRFVRKLSTLLLSKPRHYIPIRILSRHCRPYLTVPPSRPLLPLILRYPLIFHLIRSPPPNSFLSVSLSPAALSLFSSSDTPHISDKLYKLLLLSSHPRLLLSKLVHLAPDLGFPPNFRSRLCVPPFRTIHTSYGHAVELTSCHVNAPLPFPTITHNVSRNRPIIDRPPKFRQLQLRRGLNVKRKHMDYLLNFQELPEVNPYRVGMEECGSFDLKERRACTVVREVLGMTLEKRMLVDHLTHFRKEFGLPNKLRAMLVRHPEMFYVSVKGDRDSVFLMEGYDERGRLVVDEVDEEMLKVKRGLEELVKEGKRIRRVRRRGVGLLGNENKEDTVDDDDEEDNKEYHGNDGLHDLFETGIGDDWEEFGEGDDGISGEGEEEILKFWSLNGAAENIDIVNGEERVEAW